MDTGQRIDLVSPRNPEPATGRSPLPRPPPPYQLPGVRVRSAPFVSASAGIPGTGWDIEGVPVEVAVYKWFKGRWDGGMLSSGYRRGRGFHYMRQVSRYPLYPYPEKAIPVSHLQLIG